MKLDCGPTWQEKREAREKWHKWFAWHPVRIGSHDCRWLETIERKGKFYCCFGDGFWEFEYRILN